MVLTLAETVRPDLRGATAAGFERLCAWAVCTRDKPLPEPIRRRAALVLADDLGAMAVASGEPPVQAARAPLAASSGPAEATVFAQGAFRLDRATAAAANGLAVTWAELDEGYRAAPCHAGAYILPALLAEAEATDKTTGEVLVALALAYEITARLARAFPSEALRVHPHAAFASIGAAAGVALSRGTPRLLEATAAAASMAFAGPYRHAVEGALVRNAWTAVGAWTGLRAVDLAEAGIGGIATGPYDTFVTCFGAQARPEELDCDLGSDWAIAGGYHKIHACCQYAHSAVEASLALHRRLPPDRGARDIAEIVVETHPLGLTLTNAEPATDLAAKFSMPHAMAAVAATGSGGQQAFSGRALNDPTIAALRRNVVLQPHPEIGPRPKDRPARVTWKLRDGTIMTEACDSARGGADRPFDDETLMRKLAENTREVFPAMADELERVILGRDDVLEGSWWRLVADMVGARSVA